MNCRKHGFNWPHDKTCPYCDVERLEKLVHLPGHWKCQNCDFYLVSTNLHAASGNFSANDKPHDCANGCGPMWRVTHEQSANDMVDSVERLTAEVSRLTMMLEEYVRLDNAGKIPLESVGGSDSGSPETPGKEQTP